MTQPNRQHRVEEALDQLRRELDRQDSLRPQLDERLAGAKNAPRHRLAPLAVAVVALVLSLVAVWWYRAQPPQPTVPLPIVKLELGETELVQHAATLVDNAVVVVWSCRGAVVSPQHEDEQRIGKYRVVVLRQETLPDGRIVSCSLFLPDADVRPLLDPPSLTARGADQRLIALSAAPRPVSAAEFDKAVRSAGLLGAPGLELSDVDREIRKRLN